MGLLIAFMSYHIPSDEQLTEALNKVFKEFHVVQSQNKLRELVTEELNTKKEKYGVSATRLRSIAIKSGFIKLEIHSRDGDPKKVMTKCPVCGVGLDKVKNLTIWGGEVTIEFYCRNCSYRTGKKKRIPTLYVFHLKKKTN